MSELSIIVYARCAEAFLGKTLESICGQSFQDWECIVVDDGSRDQTSSLVEKFVERDSRFTLVRQSYGGVARAKNRGFLESIPTTSYVSFIDAGDVWAPTAIAELIAHLRNDVDAVGAHGIAVDMDEKTEFGGLLCAPIRGPRLEYRNRTFRELPSIEPTSFAALICGDILSPSGVLVARRSAYETAGLYDPKLQGCEQWGLTLRLCGSGSIRYLDKVVLQSSSMGRNCLETKRWRIGVRRVQLNTFFSPKDSPSQRAILNEGWRALHWIKIRKNWKDAFEGCVRGAPVSALKSLSLMPFHVLDYLAGHPLSGCAVR